MTAEVIDRPIPLAADPELSATGAARSLVWVPRLLGGALLVVVLYAVFDHGAVGLAPGARVEVAVALIAAVAGTAWLGFDALRLRASRIAFVGLALLGGFVCWSALTLLWSVAPDQTWIQVNRGTMYVVVVALGMAIGATEPRAPAMLARGFLVVAGIVAFYALAQKLVPGLHVAGVLDLNLTGSIPRLQEPIGYWNALALFLVLGVPAALHLTLGPARSPDRRLLSAGMLELLFLTIGLTLSRGGLLALAVALVVAVAGAERRLLAVAWLALVGVATIPPLVLGLTLHWLADPGVGLSHREIGGAILAGVLIVSLAGLYVTGRALLRYEPRLRLSAATERGVRQISRAGLAGAVVAALLVVLLTHAWHNFTSPSAPSNVSASRLLTADSYRWLWWKEAANGFGARPLGGWGAGSFGVVHLIYRHNTLPVQQPHSVPLQFLTETGAIGALLGLGGLALLLLGAVKSVRRAHLAPAERGAAIALLAAGAGYFVHFLYDWDWDIPAVTLPALLFVGVLVGAGRPGLTPRGVVRAPLSLGTRALAIAGATLWLSLFVISAILPSLAASDANAALIKASSSSRAALTAAQVDAQRASSLDPLSDAGLRAEAAIALHRGEPGRARFELERAVGREPSDELAWNELVELDTFVVADRAGARQAARRVIALDPRGAAARALRESNLAGYGR